MSCSSIDLKAYCLGEMAAVERAPVANHLEACQDCREELERLTATRAALLSLEDQELPQRIAFVSDKVFEPRWWQSIWHSGPVMGFASAAVLAVAILVHAFVRPVGAPAPSTNVDVAQIEQRVEREVNQRLETAVAKAVADTETRQASLSKTLEAAELDLAASQQTIHYLNQQMGRLMVASNNSAGAPAQ
jgi:anti-sigma factor RsiW